jgi:hypothetical protein
LLFRVNILLPIRSQDLILSHKLTTHPDTSKKQMSMRFHAMPAENTSRIKRDEPQSVMCSKFAQDSQLENETVLRQGPPFPNHLIPWDNWSNRSKEVICMAKERASSRRPLTHQGYARLWVPTMLINEVPDRDDSFPQWGRRWMCLNRPNSATP